MYDQLEHLYREYIKLILFKLHYPVEDEIVYTEEMIL